MSVLLIKGTSAPSACSGSEAPTGQTTFCFCAFRLCWAQSLKPRWVRPVGVFNGLKSAERWTSSSWEINKASREERESNKEKLTSLFVVFLCAFYSLLFKSSLIIQHIFKQLICIPALRESSLSTQNYHKTRNKKMWNTAVRTLKIRITTQQN